MSGDQILRSWKQIAEYLHCDVKTCSRWEAECGLPVHRFDPASPRSRVFAQKTELDAWLANRRTSAPVPAPAAHSRAARTWTIAVVSFLVGTPLAWFGLKPLVFPAQGPPVIAVLPVPVSGMDSSEAVRAKSLDALLRDQLGFGGKVTVLPIPSMPGLPSAADAPARWPGRPDPDFVFRAELRPADAPKTLSVQLLDARTGDTVWSRIYENGIADLTACLESIHAEVRHCLSLPGDRRPDAAAGPSAEGGGRPAAFVATSSEGNPDDPWSQYFTALRYVDSGDAAANDLAIEMFRRILDAEPGFARAYVGLARGYANFVNYQGRKEVLWLDKSEETLAKAQSLAPDLPETYAVRIKNLMMREFLLDADTSREYFRLAGEALARYPYDGRLCGIIGACYLKLFDRAGAPSDLETALRLQRIAFSADPTALMNMALVELLLFKGEFGQALAVCDEVGRIHPLPAVALRRGEVLYYQGDLDGSLAAVQACTAPISLRVEALQFEAMIAARRGNRGRAVSLLHQIEVLNPRREAAFLDHLREASVYAGLGEADRAQALLAEGLAGLKTAGTYVLRSYIEIDPNFRGLRRNLVLARPATAPMP